jgi:hypothetical protein
MISKRSKMDNIEKKTSNNKNLKRIKPSDPTINYIIPEASGYKAYPSVNFDFKNPKPFLESKKGTPQCIPLFAITNTMHALESSSGSGTKHMKLKYLLQLFDLALLHEPLQLAGIYMVFSCKVFPDYANQDFGIGNSLIYQFLSQASKKSQTLLKSEMKKVGDLGTLGGKYINSDSTDEDKKFSKITFEYWLQQIKELTQVRKCF